MQNSPDWFTHTEVAAPRPPRHTGRIIVIVAILAVLAGGGVLAYNMLTRQACLTASDYRQLAGQDYIDALDATTNFYTTLIEFSGNTAEYNNTNGNGESQLHTIARFYQSHKDTSLRITLDNTYSSVDYLALTTKRTAAIKATLVQAGVPTDHIIIEEPTYTPPEELPEYDDAPSAPKTITLSITSLDGCR